ncbi:hypothetical protein HPB50_023247 [Hyalomma asiaticum]|uniref:Uncharacterized protein n=1 Tax=Hyalomma asiaticum TaxID=266040 RepID=A0ACB7SBD0_HYAAI|nr:hypothetical protein HPB50_023247 [Hyalomma asiaticum]
MSICFLGTSPAGVERDWVQVLAVVPSMRSCQVVPPQLFWADTTTLVENIVDCATEFHTMQLLQRRVPDPSAMPGGPPPPYPGGPRPSAPPAGPSHGYGHGRGHYNSRVPTAHGVASSAGSSRHHQGSRGAVPPEAVELRPAGKRHL